MITYYTKEGKFKVHIGYISYGKLHKLNGPAIIFSSGTKKWYVNGKLHRLNGPAIEWISGRKEWYENGERHRLDGPAIIKRNGHEQWWINGKRHRIDGPAIEWKNGFKRWYINDKRLDTNEVESWIKSNNINLKTKQHQALFMVRFG